ncbi:AFG2-interacting ribosome maturation factor [Chanos chanos]|uniref:AFG2-interacting ribosome maturation factor n=1 Tax=Chanos chanos TaxID=29144 RepID=A0A6J2WP13_CHACN|nr:uncharacterized protein C1orf109 homolog [Chanos chanos]
MSNPALLSLHQLLKQSFRVVEQNHKVWKSVLLECSPLVSSLGNLGEQLRALKNVQVPQTPLGRFPDLQERLHYKLSIAVDTVMGKLGEKLDAFEAVRDAVSKQVSAAFQFYERNTGTLDIACCVNRSAVTPSLADMLEWLQDTDRYYRLQFLKRKNFLQTLKSDDLTLLETAPKRWESLSSPNAEEGISDMLFQVSFFMDSE